ncbi:MULTISPECIES: class III extradiol ring-cleavage dioxygenase family protein [Dietzia]|uniref:Uncharacterized protein n=1 Tax=Dietzia cinnamea TaxID=321318 RepID=A0A4R3ZZJ1_9ACTN|nr:MULTISPECIES: hypothetical protein [Dietzia]KZO60401.1 hypothetical protein A2U19_01820 [Dietzia maris]MCT1886598.1 hypothetical protein [Dietzia cinnamea]MCT2059542.1 hypothetical protein [Dietzia cinnamea]MCT2099835.1 hypothetical protein [Dietzia cinnamea]MCT2122352.1 hypothetical protein [Dietzia cinnamea]
MNTSVVLVPGAPALVPVLSGSAAADSARQVDEMVRVLRRAAEDATAVRVVGADSGGRSLGDVRSTLARWGADVPVGRPGAPPAPHEAVPDAALIAWWLLDRAQIGLTRGFTGVTGPSPTTPQVAADDLVVVVADGPASLAPRAPVPEDPRGVALDARLGRWLRDPGELPDHGAAVAEEIGWWSRPAWLVLADLVGGRAARERLSWAPFGVGYHCGWWS